MRMHPRLKQSNGLRLLTTAKARPKHNSDGFRSDERWCEKTQNHVQKSSRVRGDDLFWSRIE
jgi:hypothetical protein